jgi:septal ring factor EnvC (AmiA/AmiB activator)
VFSVEEPEPKKEDAPAEQPPASEPTNKPEDKVELSQDNKETKEDENMDEKIKEAVDAAKLEFSKQMEELKTKMDTTTEQLRTKEAENSKLNATIMELAKDHEIQKAAAFDKQIEGLVNGWVKTGRVSPAQVMSLSALLKETAKVTSTIEFSAEVIEDGKTVTKSLNKSAYELINDFVNSIPENSKVDFSETAVDEGKDNDDVKSRARSIADSNPRKYKAEKK